MLESIYDKLNNYSKERFLSRFLLISDKIIGFLLTAYIANKLSYSEIGLWSQVIYFAGLYTSLSGLNISNGLISIVPRIIDFKGKFDLIYKAGLFLLLSGLFSGLILISLKDLLSNIFFEDFLELNLFIIILSIGFSEMLLEYFLFSFRSFKNFALSNYVLFYKTLPRIIVFIGVYKNDIYLMLYLYSATLLVSCLVVFLKLFLSKKYNILFFFKSWRDKFSFLSPEPYLKSLFIISKKSIFATITASLFFFFARNIILSKIGLKGVGEFSLAISAGATIIFLTNFIGFTFYPFVSNLSITEKKAAFDATNKLSLKIIFLSIIISLTMLFLKIIFNYKLNFYPFTVNSLDLSLAFLGYGFLSAYQISQPFAFSLTNDIKVIQIELTSSVFAFGLFGIFLLGNGFSIHIVLLAFCFYTLGNYLQARNRNFKILNEVY